MIHFNGFFPSFTDETYPPIYLHLIFDILQFEISSLMNWIFFPSLDWIFAGYTGSKNPVQIGKKSSSSNLKFQKSSADR